MRNSENVDSFIMDFIKWIKKIEDFPLQSFV